MVDPKDTNERTIETEAGLEQVAHKVWAKPRLESLDISAETEVNPGHSADGSGSVS